MTIIPLRRIRGGLFLVVDLRYQTVLIPGPIHFLVDSGASHTIILPRTQKRISAALKPASVHFGKKESIETLFGKKYFKPIVGQLTLICKKEPGRTHDVIVPRACFSDNWAGAATREYNLLGRDAMKGLSIYLHRPGIVNIGGVDDRPLAFLTDDGHNLNAVFLKGGDKELGSFIRRSQSKTPPPVQWLDPGGKPIPDNPAPEQ